MKEEYLKLKNDFFLDFPKLTNFSHPTPEFSEEERNYKVELHNLFKQEIIPRLENLSDFSEELEQLGEDIASFFVRKLKSDNAPQNLVGWRYHMFTQDWTSNGKISFARAVATLLTESNRNLEKGFDNFMQMLELLSKDSDKFVLTPAASRSLITFFLFIAKPDEHFFIQTGVINSVLGKFKLEKMNQPRLTLKEYRTVQTLAKSIFSYLQDDGLEPQDMIDVQSFIWRAQEYRKNKEKQDKMDEGTVIEGITMTDNNSQKQPLNLILYGPPGTGKTYHTINQALAIILEKEPNLLIQRLLEQSVDEILSDGDRQVLTNEFEKYSKNGQISFVTFHQSYGYEEFVEGIKAIPKGEEGNDSGDDMVYKVMPGTFKKLCEKAIELRSLSSIDSNLYEEISETPNVWKISLGESGSIKQDCFENNEIRIGWDNYGDLNINNQINQRELNDFYSSMDLGDLVLVFKNQWEVDGIGVVTGEYDFDDSLIDMKHKRKVTWLQVNKTLNIKEVNKGKRLTLSTLYKLHRISKIDVLNMLTQQNVKANESIIEKNYILVIDEINRGNISKIFGELITLIEPSKRLQNKESLMITLPYSQHEFGVPSNLYILGTMNTADRSIALMDTALRRRFDFQEMMPSYELLRGLTVNNIDIQRLLITINQRIEYLYDRDHTIGHAYFMSLLKDNTLEQLDIIFRNKIIPLLQEYFYDDWEKIQIVLGDHYDQLNNSNHSSNKEVSSFNDKINSLRFIQSRRVNETDIIGFNHDEIEDNAIDYRVNPDPFRIENYVKIYESDIMEYSTNESSESI